MALFSVSPKPVSLSTAQCDGTAEKIKRRRYQILVHSLLYYELNINLVSDSQWSEWATELAELQRQNPEVSNSVIFADEFKTFDGSSGFDLPYKDEQIVNIAYRLLRIVSSRGDATVNDALRFIQYMQTTPAHYSGFVPTDKPKPKQVNKRKVVKKDEPKRKKLF